jgi:hypothetical protein
MTHATVSTHNAASIVGCRCTAAIAAVIAAAGTYIPINIQKNMSDILRVFIALRDEPLRRRFTTAMAAY